MIVIALLVVVVEVIVLLMAAVLVVVVDFGSTRRRVVSFTPRQVNCDGASVRFTLNKRLVVNAEPV